MRIVLNTRVDLHGSRLGIHGLFLGYGHDVEAARRRNPRLRIVLFDPKPTRRTRMPARS